MAETLLTQQISADGNNYNSYANRSFIMARQHEWDHALEDAVRVRDIGQSNHVRLQDRLTFTVKSISIRPSLPGYISKGIALCGKMHFGEMVEAFDIAFMFTDGDSNAIHVLLLIKARKSSLILVPCLLYLQAIAIFNAGKYKEAMIRIQELAAACPNADTLACRVVEVSIIHSMKPRFVHRLIFWFSHVRPIYVFNWASMPWTMGVTKKRLTILLLLSVS